VEGRSLRILVLSFYYRPDLCAGSFRTTAFVAALRERSPPGTIIEVITTLQNRYHTFTQEAAEIEFDGEVEIHRIKLPGHRSDMMGQSRAFLKFSRGALRMVSDRQYDLVFATSSRLMTASLGAWIARRKRAALYLDIRDIFVDTIGDVLPKPVAWPASRLFSLLERWTFGRADRINLVSRGFEQYFCSRYERPSLAWFTNGIDDEFLAPEPVRRVPVPSGAPVTILYAGNIGEGQGLHEVLPGLALALRGRAWFLVIGDGGRRAALESAVMRAGLDNVTIEPPMPRGALLEAYRRADVLFLHLGSHRAFELVLPSKVFEYAALGKPVLAGVAGYAARFIGEEIENAAVFPPCDVSAGVRAFHALDIRDCPRPGFVAKYARGKIAQSMADDVLALVGLASE
jgi:glycosyltransferase involved in cell wall biosynthesis